MRIRYLFLLTAILSFTQGRQLNGQKKNDVRPNIVFICTDDQAYWTVGYAGNRQAHTPNLDRLAEEGAFFRNAFVTTPVCSPSRASLMASRYASECGIPDFIPQPGHRLYDAANPTGLDTAVVTFPELLQKTGYQTALIGKWHLGDWTETPDTRFHPTQNGFQYFMGLTGGGTSPVDPVLEKNGVVQKFKGLTDDILTIEALNFIDSARNAPFLLCLHYRSPHTAWLPVADEDWAPYANLDPEIPNPGYPDLDTGKVKRRMREYLASTSGVDRNVGQIIKKLSEAGISGRTIVIFTSDNGYNMGHNGIEHKGNGIWITKQKHLATANVAENSRPNLYDNSLKVPAIVRWPGVVRPGMVIDELITNLDWYPTLVEIAGGSLPGNQPVRGRSIVPLLTGTKAVKWDNGFYGEYSMIHYSKAFMRCYRTPEWKLVKDFLDSSRDELYYLKEDPEERNNLIGSGTPEATRMIRVLTRQMKQKMGAIKDPLLYGKVFQSPQKP